MLETAEQLTKFAIAIVGSGSSITWLWTWKNDRFAQYRYLDESYRKVLESYAAAPHFGDKDRTASYRDAFKGDDRLKYHYFAAGVHNFLETLYDTIRHPRKDAEWGHIFRHHAGLHRAWLNDHQDLHGTGYVKLALARS